jgi:hypothetical protein
MFEQQWDEAGEHPGRDVLSHDSWRHSTGISGLLSVHRESGPLAARQPVLACCRDIAAELAVFPWGAG